MKHKKVRLLPFKQRRITYKKVAQQAVLDVLSLSNPYVFSGLFVEADGKESKMCSPEIHRA